MANTEVRGSAWSLTLLTKQPNRKSNERKIHNSPLETGLKGDRILIVFQIKEILLNSLFSCVITTVVGWI